MMLEATRFHGDLFSDSSPAHVASIAPRSPSPSLRSLDVGAAAEGSHVMSGATRKLQPAGARFIVAPASRDLQALDGKSAAVTRDARGRLRFTTPERDRGRS
jgi:hypothetical protein